MYAKVSGTQGGLAKHLKSIIKLVNMQLCQQIVAVHCDCQGSLAIDIFKHDDLCVQALQKVLKGFRLPPPPGCSKQVYELMIKCW